MSSTRGATDIPKIRRRGVFCLPLSVALIAAVFVGLQTDFQSAPRFDGAGYAVLAESLRTGQGYRAIDHPDAPRHGHFPPGYPAILAVLWSVTGPSFVAARVLSVVCVSGAVLSLCVWLRHRSAPLIWLPLSLAIAVNWNWGRVGGSIQAEPLFLLQCGLVFLAIDWACAGGAWRGLALGGLLAACVLTRHVGVMLAAAVFIDLACRSRWRHAAFSVFAMCGVIAPWIVWLVIVDDNTQAGLLPRAGIVELIGSQGLFYAQRIPDVLIGPLVETGTIYQPTARVPATIGAGLVTLTVVWGWMLLLRRPRWRITALVALCTLALLLIWPFTEAGRFLVPLLPSVLLGAWYAIANLGSRLARLRPPRARAVVAWALLAASLPYPAYTIVKRWTQAAQFAPAPFDAACLWLRDKAAREGPVMVRQSGEAYWLMSQRRRALPPPEDATAAEIDELVLKYRVAYLIVDDARFTGAGASPLAAYVLSRVGGVRLAGEFGTTRVYEVLEVPGAGQGTNSD